MIGGFVVAIVQIRKDYVWVKTKERPDDKFEAGVSICVDPCGHHILKGQVIEWENKRVIYCKFPGDEIHELKRYG
jgi:hypothetical protein